MEDVPTGQLVSQDNPAGSAETGSAETEPAETEPAETEPAETEPAETGSRDVGHRTGGRRYRAGRPPPQRLRAYEQPRAQATPFPAAFGAWGTLAGLFACCLISCLLAAWLHLIVLAGLGFCAGCAVAAWVCQRAALLRMVIAVPSVFLVAEVIAQLATLHSGGRRGLALPVTGGTLLTLAAVAPWLFAGTAGAVVIAMFRGLPQCVRDLRAGLRGGVPARQAPRGPQAQQALRARQALLAELPPRAQRRQARRTGRAPLR
jgi:Domain of unknown function (DUF6542)